MPVLHNTYECNVDKLATPMNAMELVIVQESQLYKIVLPCKVENSFFVEPF